MMIDDRSDFAAPVAAFLYIAMVATISVAFGICKANGSVEMDTSMFYFLGVGGLVVAGFNLFKAYLAEGFSTALFALLLLTMDAGYSIPATIGLGILFFFCALVSYSCGIKDIALIDALTGVIVICTLGVEMHMAIVALVLILGAVPAVIAFYVAYNQWTYAEEAISEYEDEFFGDECCCDDEECCCSEEHPEGCECEECKGEAPAEDAPAEEPEEEPAEEAVEEAAAEEPAAEAPAEEAPAEEPAEESEEEAPAEEKKEEE